MFEQILLLLLKTKFYLIAGAKIPVIAALLVLGTTGFIVTGTISTDHGDDDGDDDGGRIVNLTVKPLESKKCIDALIAQTETLLQLDVLAGDANAQLRRMRERARDNADDQHKLLDEAALLERFGTSSLQVRDALAAARQDVLKAADLGGIATFTVRSTTSTGTDTYQPVLDKCQDRNPDTTVNLDVALLRVRYDEILRDFGRKLTVILTDAQQAFDELVKNAPPKPRPVNKGSASNSASGH